MIFKKTKINGVYIIKLQPLKDKRGFFARSFCRNEFQRQGLNPVVAQCNVSYNKKKGTLRGMHYQIAPYAEAKLVSCVQGAIFDVVVDLRRNSATYCQWLGVKLSALNATMLYVPEGLAHGFQTLMDDTIVLYQMSEFYHPEASRGIRWDDPVFGIKWPQTELFLSEKDRRYRDFVMGSQPGW